MKKVYILVLAGLILTALVALPALAQNQFGTNALNNISVYSTRSLTSTIVGIVNIILGFLGAIAVLLFLYAGWLWLSSRGEATKIQKSKMVMASAAIGLLIIFSSYAIANFVITRLAEETGVVNNTNGGTLPPGPGQVTCDPPTTAGTVKICDVYPAGAAPGNYLTVTGWNFGTYTTDSRVALRDNLGGETNLELVNCNGNPIWNQIYQTPNGQNAFFELRAVVPDITRTSYDVRVYRDSSTYDPEDVYNFAVINGGVYLNIACLRPSSGPVTTEVIAEGINFGQTAGTVTMLGWLDNASTPTTINVPVTSAWSENNLTLSIPDTALSSMITITNTAGNSDSRYFSVSCDYSNNGNSQCNSDCCSVYDECQTPDICLAGGNVSSGPYISGLSPDNGAARNFITIFGQNFGEDAGEVWFGSLAGLVPTDINASCVSDYWHDNYIVIGVPDAVTDSNVYIVTQAGVQSINQVFFEATGITRPGLCQLTPLGGSYQGNTLVRASGVNFASGDDMLYSDIPGYNIQVNSEFEAQSNVPNLQNGEVGVQMKNDLEQYSNPLPFEVSDSFFGQPVISNISPNGVKDGVYITITGQNFGSLPGQVLFDDAGDAIDQDIPGIVPANEMCQDSYWQNNQIVIEVPNLPNDSNGRPYEIKISRADAQVSEAYNATYNTSLQNGAFLCAVIPNNGPNNFAPVNFFGTGFNATSTQGGVRIQFNQASGPVAPSYWNDYQAMNVAVPSDAVSGPVVLQSLTDAGTWVDSNPLNFDVMGCSDNNDCPGGEICCEGNLGNYCASSCSQQNSCTFAYNITTQNNPFAINYNYNCESDWQSPTPWPDGRRWVAPDGTEFFPESQDAFKNANIAVTFTRNVIDSDLSNSHIRLYECTGRNSGCNTELPITISIINPNSNQEGVVINPNHPSNPNGDLAPETWYQVRLLGNFRAEGTNEYWNMVEHDLDLVNVGGWNFRTRPDDLDCQVGSIQVTPQPDAANFYLGSYRDFYAAAQANNCNLCGGSYDWNWSLQDPNITAASFYPAGNNYNQNTSIGHTQLRGDIATEFLTDNHINLQCSITQDALVYSNNSQPKILAPVLLVENYGPICDNSCANGEVWIDFNTQIAASYLTSTYFSLRDCNNDASCNSSTAVPITIAMDGNFKVSLEHALLSNNHYYQVRADGDITNIHGYHLGSDLTWIFRSGAENCLLANINLSPGQATAEINDTVDYSATAFSAPNACYPSGQPIQCNNASNCSWSWQANDINGGPGVAIMNSVNDPLNTAQAAAEGVASIIATASQTGNNFSSNGVLTVVDSNNNNVQHGAPRVIDYQPAPDGIGDICPNAGVMIRFSEVMDENSVRDKVALYGIPAQIPDTNNDGVVNIGDIPGLINEIEFLDRIQANYLITHEDTDGDMEPDQTLVLINPNNLLRSNTFHRILVQGGVMSVHGVPLDILDYNFDADDVTGNDSFSSTFTTRLDTCRVSYLRMVPASDRFVCNANNCLGDYQSATPGNQHLYTALPFDVRGVYLSYNFDYSWSLNDDGTDLISPATGIGQSFVGTVNSTNGEETLVVTADGGPDVGSATNSVGISVFLCETPWPALSNFPWQDNTYNFSTYYCADQDNGDNIASLPVLNYPPLENANHPASVLREYIFPVIPVVALGEGNTFGSLAQGLFNQSSSWWSRLVSKFSQAWQAPVAQGQSANMGTDIIAVRVMTNNEHLSVADWYRLNAPNPNVSGVAMEVDGYPALQVGNTVYVSAFNLDAAGDNMYTNIYILAYNIGARDTTVEIFNQFLENFKLNINVDQQNNICSGGGNHACSSDFDCANHSCQSRGLKLRRDLVRLGDLLNVKVNLDSYGNSHRTCSNNSLIACSIDAQCPVGGPCDQCPSSAECVPSYPLLNAGTFVSGQSNSKWPSWQQTLADSLSTTLALDPINQFNGCTGTAYEGYDAQTCWNEETLTFQCPTGSLIYHYQRNNTGNDYDLSANFEYQLSPWSGIDFSDLSNLDSRINTILQNCSSQSANLTNPACGNGRIDTGEECDGGFQDNQCNPVLSSIYGVHDWWNEQSVGCYPAGSIVNGNLVECTWYEPEVDTMLALCGGYCGNGAIESTYEDCEVINGSPNYSGVDYSCPANVSLNCDTSCQAMCGVGPLAQPAAACGDGLWTEGVEECDATGNPNGLSEWDCTNNGNASCTNTCTVSCDNGLAYAGRCGDGTIQSAGEECDYASYDVPTPDESSVNYPYTCQQNCTFGSEYCNDNILQAGFQEVCDTSLAVRPTPPNSSRYSQYQCRDTSAIALDPRWTKCTPTAGGWCGDGTVQDGDNGTTDFGEICDSNFHPAPINSSQTNQYSCTYNCYSMTGGWCGDSIIQNGSNGTVDYGEDCDYASWISPSPAIANDVNLQYVCSNACLANSGGWCGDNIIQNGTNGTTDFGEDCEANYVVPGIGQSTTTRQYACSDCMFNASGYCGDSIIQQPYNVCATIVGGQWVNLPAASEAACLSQSGTWRPIEQCDVGTIPANRNVELVFVFDVSRSLDNAATALCTALGNVMGSPDLAGISYKITVMTMGDNAELTASTTDDIINIAPYLASAHQAVFNNLVTNCQTYANLNNPSGYNNPGIQLRYLSFYDNASNNINGGVSIFNNPDDYTTLNGCNDDITRSPGGRLENWGYASKRVIESYNWQPGYQRIIIPVSDEYAWCGGDVSAGDLPAENENNTGNQDVVADIISAALNSTPKTHVSPVILRANGVEGIATTVSQGSANQALGDVMATATGGMSSNFYSNWSTNLVRVINSAFCDGNGDGVMDCSLPVN